MCVVYTENVLRRPAGEYKQIYSGRNSVRQQVVVNQYLHFECIGALFWRQTIVAGWVYYNIHVRTYHVACAVVVIVTVMMSVMMSVMILLSSLVGKADEPALVAGEKAML